MLIEATRLPGVVIVTPNRFGDARGHFSEVWNRDTLRGHAIDIEFVQDNQSLSRDVGVVRGLHCQAPPRAQDKLVRVAQGAIFDVAVDVRRGSETYGQWVGVELSAENGRQLLVPRGFLHGFVTRPVSQCSADCMAHVERQCMQRLGAVERKMAGVAVDMNVYVFGHCLSISRPTIIRMT